MQIIIRLDINGFILIIQIFHLNNIILKYCNFFLYTRSIDISKCVVANRNIFTCHAKIFLLKPFPKYGTYIKKVLSHFNLPTLQNKHNFS